MTISLIIAEDHAFTLDGMQRAFAIDPDFSVIETASRGIDAIRLVRMHKPVIAVLDYAMPDMTGLEAMEEIKRWAGDTKVVIVTGVSDPATVVRIFESNADGLFSKGDDPKHIRNGLRDVALGEKVIGDGFQHLKDATGDAPNLSPREREVLNGIASGLTNAKMATLLGISPKTVDSHRTSLMRKLNANTTATLLVRAFERGLISWTHDSN